MGLVRNLKGATDHFCFSLFFYFSYFGAIHFDFILVSIFHLLLFVFHFLFFIFILKKWTPKTKKGKTKNEEQKSKNKSQKEKEKKKQKQKWSEAPLGFHWLGEWAFALSKGLRSRRHLRNLSERDDEGLTLQTTSS